MREKEPGDGCVGVTIAGVELMFCTDCVWTLHFLRSMFFRHLSPYGASPTVGSRHQVHIRFTDFLPQTSISYPPRWKGVKVDGTTVSIHTSGPESFVLFVGDQVTLWVDGRGHFTTCHVQEKSVGSGGRKRPQPFGYIMVLVQFLLSMYGRYIIHAAGIVHENKAWLLLGESCAGKTTTSMDLAGRGLGFMGDDLCLLERRNEIFYAHALLLKPRPKTIHKNSAMVEKPEAFLDRCRCVSQAPLARLFCLEGKSTAPHAFFREKAGRVAGWLLAQGNAPNFSFDPDHWTQTVFQCAKKVPAWRWRLGPVNAPEVVQSLVRLQE